jgi:hypothetical protein
MKKQLSKFSKGQRVKKNNVVSENISSDSIPPFRDGSEEEGRK